MKSRHAGLVFALLACVCLIAGMCRECWAAPVPVSKASLPGHDCCPKPQPSKSACQSNPTDLLAADPNPNSSAGPLGADLTFVAPALSAVLVMPLAPGNPVREFDTSPPPHVPQTTLLRL